MTLIELAQQAGINPKWVAGTSGGEYHSACPLCGGTDRFYIQPHRQMSKCLGSYRCRQCGIYGDSIQFAHDILHYPFREAAQVVNAIIPERNVISDYHLSSISRPLVLQKPSALWITRATDFVNCAHNNLLNNANALAYLAARGLPLEAVIQYKLGWSDKDAFLPRTEWGLSQQLKPNGNPRSLWIPSGLIIPHIEPSGEIVRLKIRRSKWNNNDKMPKYVVISGSMNGLSIVGNTKSRFMIVVESELDAYAINYVADGVVCTVAVGSNIKNPDNVTDHVARKVEHLLICHDNDNAGIKMLTKWKKLYAHARAHATPVGKDIGEAINLGLNIREWLIATLPTRILNEVANTMTGKSYGEENKTNSITATT